MEASFKKEERREHDMTRSKEPSEQSCGKRKRLRGSGGSSCQQREKMKAHINTLQSSESSSCLDHHAVQVEMFSFPLPLCIQMRSSFYSHEVLSCCKIMDADGSGKTVP